MENKIISGNEQVFSVCFFPNILRVGENKPIEEILHQIKNGYWKSEIEEIQEANKMGETLLADMRKKQLPAFTPSGEFNGRHNLLSLSRYNPIVILDFDYVGEDKIHEVRQKVEKEKYTWVSFVSPRGAGLKVLVKVSSAVDNHQNAFSQVKNYYEKIVGYEADVKNKDISRLCFVSFDPELFYNEEATIFDVIELSIEEKNKENFEKAVAFTNRKETYLQGNRNNFIHLLACNCNRYGLDEQTTLKFLLAEYKGLTVEEIKSTVQSAFNNTGEHGSFSYVSSKTKDTVTFCEPFSTMVCSVFDLIKKNEQEPEHAFIWNGIKESSFGYIYGPPKVAKTIFCENLGMSIAAGKVSYLGFPIDQSKPRKVLFIGMEEFWKNRATRHKKQLDILNIEDPDNFQFKVVTNAFPGRLATKEDWELIDKIIEHDKPDVVFIDSMTRTVIGEIEDSSTSRDASFKLRELVRKYGITLIMIHHTTKLHKKELDLDKLAGSRVIAQEADFIYGINRKENTRFIKEVATRYKAQDEREITFKITDDLWLETDGETVENSILTAIDARKNPANDQIIVDAIQEQMRENEFSVETKIIQEVVADSIKKTELYRRLKKLTQTGKIIWERGYVSLPQNNTENTNNAELEK